MESKVCPNCNKSTILVKDIILKGILNQRIICSSCGIRVKVKPRFIPYIFTDFLSQVIFLFAVLLSLTFQSWLILLAAFIGSFLLFIPCYVMGKLEIVDSPFNRGLDNK